MAKKRRRKLKKGPIFILFLIILLITGFVVYYMYTHTNKYLFFKGVSTSKDNLITIYDDLKENYVPYINSNYHNNTDTLVELETKELKSSVSFKGDIFLTDTINYFDLLINANDSEYGLELLTKEDKLYFRIDDSKYYYTDYARDGLIDESKYFDIIKFFYEAIDEETSNGDFTKKDIELTIDSKNYDTKKISLSINQDLYDKIIDSFLKKIDKDEIYTNILLLLTNCDKKEDMINYLKSFKVNDSINYSIYLYKSAVIRHEIDEYKLSYTSLDNYFELNKNNSYIKLNNNDISLFIEGILYGNGKYDDKSFNIDFTDYSDNSLGNIKYSISSENKKYLYNLDLSINLELIKYTIKSNNSVELNKKVSSIDLKDSIVKENMSSNDKNILGELLSLINDIIDF